MSAVAKKSINACANALIAIIVGLLFSGTTFAQGTTTFEGSGDWANSGDGITYTVYVPGTYTWEGMLTSPGDLQDRFSVFLNPGLQIASASITISGPGGFDGGYGFYANSAAVGSGTTAMSSGIGFPMGAGTLYNNIFAFCNFSAGNAWSISIVVTCTPPSVLTSMSPSGNLCVGSSKTLTASGADTYTWAPSTGLSATTGAAVTASPTTTTTYTITGTSGGCTGTATRTITVSSIPTVTTTVSPTGNICAGASKTITASGATTYIWAPTTGLSATTGATVTASPTTTTTYTVTGSTSGCSDQATRSVTVLAAPTVTISASPSASMCVGDSRTLTASGAVSYTWTPATSLSATTGATVACTSTVTRTYTVTGTGSNGCTKQVTQTVTVNTIPTVATSVSPTGNLCMGSSKTLTASGATTYTWAPATGLSATTGSTVTASPYSTTTYTVTGANGVCTNVATRTINVINPPNITSTSALLGIPGSNITITGTGFNGTNANNIVYFGATRATVTGSSTTSLTATVPVGATHKPITLNNQNCDLTGYSQYPFLPTYNNSAFAPSTVNFAAKVGVAVSGPADGMALGDIDGDGKVDLVVVAGYVAVCRNTSSSGSITSGSFASPVLFDAGSATRVAIADIDGDGKPDLIVTSISENTVRVLRNTSSSGSITSSSFDAAVPFSAGSYPYEIAIGDIDDDGRPDIAVTNSFSTTISVLRNTSSSGSISSSSFATLVTFTVGSQPKGIAIGDLDGDGKADLAVANGSSNTISVLQNTSSSGSITSGSFATQVTFATGGNPSDLTIGDIDGDGKPDLVVGNYTSNTVSVLRNTSSSGSITSGSFATQVQFATVSLPFKIDIGDIDGDGKPDLAIASYHNTASVLRNNSISGSITSGSFDPQVTFNIGSDPYDIALGDIDGDGRSDMLVSNYVFSGSQIYVLRNNPLSPITGTATVCAGSTTILSNAASGGTWSSSNTAIATVGSSTGVVTGVAAGTVTITYAGTAGASFAGNRVTTTVTVNALPTVATSVSPTGAICVGSSKTITASGASTYTWAPATGLSATTGATVTASPTTTTIYTVTGTASTGCTDQATRQVSVNALPTVTTTTSPSGPICRGDSKTLTASGASTYTWAPATGLSATTGTSVTASPTTTVTYTVTGTDANGCVDQATRQVSVNALPTAAIAMSPTGNLCTGNSKTLTASGASTYTWAPVTGLSATTGSVVTASPTVTTTYTVTGTDANGCSDEATRTITVIATPTVTTTVSPTGSLCMGSSKTITASGATTYTWAPATGLSATTGAAVAASPTVTTTYTVTGTTSGCTDQATRGVTVIAVPTVTASASPSGAICRGSFTVLTAGGAVTYTWAPATDLSATTGATVTASPTVTTTYTVTGTDANGCSDEATRTITITNPPVITSVSSLVGIPGNTCTITGTGFNGANANNIVFFGATRATVNGSTTTSLTATVPVGATYKEISLNNQNCDLTGYAQYPFLPTYNNSAFAPATVNFAIQETFASGASPNGLAIGDIDGDGKPDLVLTNYSDNSVSVYRNTSTSGSITAGSFAPQVTFTTGSRPISVAIGDLDGDGKPDLAVANQISDNVSVLRNTSSSGSITSSSFDSQVTFTTGSAPRSVAIGDIDGDGKPDLALPNGGSNTVSVIRNTSTSGGITSGSFAAQVAFATGSTPRDLALGDIDGDGKPDLAIVNRDANTVSVLRNTSNSGSINSGSFAAQVSFATRSSPSCLAIGDIDGDGKPDLAIANTLSDTVSILRNTSSSGSITSGSFATQVTFQSPITPRSLAIGDIDGDGKPDLAVASISNRVSVFRNTSSSGSITSGSFATPVAFAAGIDPTCLAIGDLDGDGKPDVAVTNAGSNNVSVLRNNPLSPITGTLSVCVGSTTALSNATTGGTWSSSNTARATVDPSTGVVTGVGAGTVTINYAGNALVAITGNRVTTTVTINALPTISAGANVAICRGSNTTLTATGASTFTWSPNTALSATTGASVTASPTTTVTYTVTGTTSGCSNVATKTITITDPPVITSVSSFVGIPGNTRTITGTGFNGTNANNIVYFGATRATVTGSSSTSLTATVPVGATYMPITLNNQNCDLTGYSQYPFLPTYNNSAYAPSTVNFATQAMFSIPSLPQSMAIGDLDGDGKIDMAVIAGNVYVCRNISSSGSLTSGSFAAPVGFGIAEFANRVTIGDIDGDGKPDLVVLTDNAKVSVLRNTSSSGSITSGSFAAEVTFTTGSATTEIAIGDIDGDGKPDLAVTNTGSNTVSVLRNTSSSGSITSGSFAAPVTFAAGSVPVGIAIGDIDGDGKPDLAVANFSSNTVSVLRNTSSSGSITLATQVTFATGSHPYNIAIGDIDGDGKPDLAVANFSSNTVSVLRNTSSSGSITLATQVAFATGSNPNNIAIGDIDGDGNPDLAVVNGNSYTVSILRNTSSSGSITSGSFAAQVTFATGDHPKIAPIGDMDGDGKSDLVVANNSSGTISLLRNNPLSPITGTAGVCPGATTTLSNATSGGRWSSSNTAIATVGSTTGVVTGVASGTVTITYAGTAGASFAGNRVTTTVTVLATPTVTTSASPGMAICIGSSQAITASGATTYTWAPATGLSATTGATVTASPSTTTTYTITGTASGCTGQTSLEVTVNPLPTISAGATTTICRGSSSGLTATGGATYTWAPNTALSATTGATVVTTTTVTRTYTVTGTDANGCVNTATKMVSVNPLPTISAGAGVTICSGNSTSMTATGGATYTWAPNSALSATTGATVTASPAATVSYTVTGTNANGCSNTATKTVTVNAAPTITAGSNVTVCRGTSTTLTASGGTTYTWTPNTALSATTGSSVTATPTTTVTYTVTGTTSGCTSTATQTVSVNPLPTISAGATVTICRFLSTTLTATGGSTYTWSPGTGLSATTGASVTASPTTTVTYTVTGTDANSCVNTATKMVSVNATIPTITAAMAPAGNLCMGSSKTLTAAGATTYTWAPATGLSATTGTSVTATPYSNVMYTVTGTTSACSNTATVSITLTNPPAITSASAITGIPGTAITITGTGFNATNANNIVYFGATRATVTGSSTTSLTATVPLGAMYAPITLNNQNCHLTDYAQYPFLPTYNNSAFASATVNFDARSVFTAGAFPSGVAIGDLDGDGKADLAVTNEGSDSIYVYRNISSSGSITSGSFATPVPFVTGGAPHDIAIGDLDGDGKADLAVANFGTNTVSVYRNTSSSGSITSGSFATQVTFSTGANPYVLEIGDMDGDGRADLVVSLVNVDLVSVLRNKGSSGSITSSSFAAGVTFATGIRPSAVAISDIDGDGKPDVVTANSNSNSVSVLRNTSSTGSFTSGSLATRVTFATGDSPLGLAIGDLDGDGKADLAVANQGSSSMNVYRNTSSSGTITTASFATPVTFSTGAFPNEVAIADIDGDGKPDLAVPDYGSGTVSIYRNTSSSGSITSGSFAARVAFASGSSTYGFAAGDMDGDGKADLVVTNTEASTVSVLRNNPLSPISGATIVCIGTATTLSNTASGGTWSSSNTAIATVGSSTGIVTGVATGTVTITYAGFAGASFAGNRVTMVMTVNAPPTTTAGSDVTVCSGSSTALTASGGTTYTWAPNTALSATTGASVTSSPTTTVTYTVTGTTNGCSSTATQTVSVNPLPTISAGTTVTICSLSSATLTATGGDTYTWSPATGLDATTGATVTASPTTTVTYTITGTDANGCVNTATKMVSVNALPTISAGVGVAICSGNSTSMTATGGATYTWSPGTDLSATTGTTVTASPTTTVTYTVTGANANGCVNTATKTVTVNATPTITTGSDVSICRGTSTALTASGATTYTWAPNTALSATTGATVTASPTTTVTYTVTGTTTGCTSTATQTVSVNPLPTISAGATVTICRFSSATLTATGGDTYTWSPAVALDATTGATVTASPTTTVTYTVTGTDANGCSKTATKMVSVNALPTISAGAGIAICSGNSTSMTATGGTTYTWSPGTDLSATTGATVTASPTTTVTYTVTGTNAIGCSNTATKTVTVNALPTVSGGADVAICYGSSTVLSASGATAFTWSPGTGLSATTGASVTAANTVTTTYTITGTSSGCSGTATVTVTVNPLSDAGTITGASAVTVGSVLTLSNVVTGGVWSSSDTTVASVDSTGNVTGISAGTVTISYITTNGCGSVSTTKTITVNALLETDITGTLTVCAGVTTTLSNVTAGGVWSSANEAVASVGSASGVVTGVSAGTSTITYALPGSYVTAVVSVYAMPAAITGAGSVCTNTPIILACTTTGGAWSSSNTTNATIDSTGSVTGLTAGTANISYTISGGCRSTKTITINASPSAISGSLNGCIGVTNTLTCTPTGGAWVSGTTSVATINSFGQATGFAGGVSAISYILSSGCLTTSTLTINALPDSVSGTAVVCAGLTTALTGYPSGGTWSSGNTGIATVGSTTGVVNGLLLGTARITYTNASGCYKIKIVTVNAAPLAITGTAAVCVGNTTTLACPGGGTWVSSNTAVGTIGTSGIVGGVSDGITTITYTLYTGCSRTLDVTVNSAPTAITGTANICVGTTTALASTPSGGAWSSSGITVGTVGSSTGVVAGISGGAVTISYTIAGGCRAIRVVTVNNNPPSIGGTATLITGGTTTLTNTMTGGAWSSGATGIATVGSTGVVFGAGPGTAVISYTSAAGCAATKTVTVSGTTGSITGVTTLCVGSTTSLSCFPSGGTWTSANTAVATVGSTGVVTGVSVGTAIISYDLSGTIVTTIVTVNAMPGSVTGTAVLCASGGTTTLSCTPGGGTWSSAAATVATVGSTSGVVTGVSAGTAVITYSTGGVCYSTLVVTVNAAPAAITGTANVCPAATTTLGNVTVGGTWSSSAIGIATVNSSGVVTGVAPGMATISYQVGSCAATKVVTVNSLPGSIGSPSVLCSGIPETLTVTPSGGSWSSSSTAVGTINSTTGAFVGLTGGTTTVTYLLATGCRSETVLTVNESPAAISGPTTVCPGTAITLVSATSGGTWSSSDTAVASISTSGVVTGLTYGTANISYTTGSCSAVKLVTVNTAFTSGLTYNICQGGTKTLVDSLPGGTWSSSTPSVATVVSGTGVATAVSVGMTTITYFFGGVCSKTTPLYVQSSSAVISGASTVCEGLTTAMSVPSTSSGGAWTSSDPSVASINLSTGVLSAVSAGVVTISYTQIECVTTKNVTINPVPAAITGAPFACTGLTTTLSNATGGGSWTSSSASVATVGSATGIVSGLTTGTSNISYTIANGCRRTAIVTVAATPASITGTASVCVGNTTTLASVSPGGTWSSSNSAVASASGTAGIVSGIAAGNATITYGFGGSCISTRVVTVNTTPGAITGPDQVCAGQNITFVNTLTPGTWSSGAPGIATANSSTGLIAGVSAGTATITYTATVGACKVTKVVTVNAAMPAITGGNTVCVGDAVTLATTATGGTWSSSVVAKATVGSATGVVTGVATGTTTITYMVGIGCYKTSLMVVNPLPVAISGASSVVAGSSTSLSCATSGGAWSSSNIAVGTVGSASGWVTGISAGTTTISYTIITTGCRSLKAMTVNPTTLSRGVAGVDNTDGLVFAVFPNPTQGAITVETSTAGVFTIYTIDGRLMSEHKIETSSACIRLADDIASGIYLCKFTRDNGSVETVRLIYTGQ